jgi:hypothetical protein
MSRKKVRQVEEKPENPQLLADLHHITPEGVSWRDLPGLDTGYIKLDSHTPLEEAASLARAAEATYIITCNGGGREFGYIHTETLYDMTEKLPESHGEKRVMSDMSVWRARRAGVLIPRGRWQTVGGWVCEVAGWGVLREGEVTHEDWQIKVLKSESKRHAVILQRAPRGRA